MDNGVLFTALSDRRDAPPATRASFCRDLDRLRHPNTRISFNLIINNTCCPGKKINLLTTRSQNGRVIPSYLSRSSLYGVKNTTVLDVHYIRSNFSLTIKVGKVQL